jgi:YD repeat-containing protein
LRIRKYEITWGNGSFASRSFDLRGLVSSQSLAGDTRLLDHDAAGQVTSIEDTRFDGAFDYDPLGRLSTSSNLIGVNASGATPSEYWLALAEVGSPDTSYLQSIAVPPAKGFTWNPVMPATPGDYEFRVLVPMFVDEAVLHSGF